MEYKVVDEIRQALRDLAEPEKIKTSSRFFKKGEEALVYGVKNADALLIAKEHWKQLKTYPKAHVFELCEELWKSGYLEEAIIACHFTASLHKQYEPADFIIFEQWVYNYVSNWAACDTFCNHTVGTFVMKYPEYMDELKKWATDENRWAKRAAAVTLIVPAKRGLFLNDILKIADILLLDKDDLVQKGYGWMLKAASQSHQDEIFDYILSKRRVMPRTALRYAIEKMPEELKAEAMQK